MAINLFSDYGGFYNNYKTIDIPKVDTATVSKQDEERRMANEAVPEIPAIPVMEETPVIPDSRSRMADLDNISLTFNSGEDYSYIGSDFEIGSLDMEQAISEMRKDKILEDYQYFVGTSDTLKTSSMTEDGQVFLKL